MSNTLILNWQKREEEIGGTELVFEKISDIFNSKVKSFSEISSQLGYNIKNKYHHFFVDKALIFEKYSKMYEKVNKPELIIRNSGCGIDSEFKTKTVTIFQDPSKYVAPYFGKENINEIGFELDNTYPLFQKLTAKNSINIAVSELMKKYIEEELKEKCHAVVNLGVDTEFFKPIESKEKENWIGKYKTVGMFVGKFNPLKYNFIPELVHNNPDILWIIVLITHSEWKIHSDNVILLQNLSQEELRNYYCVSDFFISTSPIESFNLCSCESASCNTKIIVSNTGIFSEWWDDRLGIKVEDYTFESFDKAVKEIITKKCSPREAIIEKGLTWENFEKNLKEAIGWNQTL